jgi:amidase
MVRIAIGTDTTGSITCPASVNGVVGLRPTRGLVSRRFIVPISLEFDTAGPLAASVRDAALALTALAGTDSGDPATAPADRYKADYVRSLDAQSLRGKRIGVLKGAKAPGSETLFKAALEVLRKSGALLVDITDEPKLDEPSKKAMGSELRRDLDSYLASTPSSVHTRSLAQVVAFNRAHAAQEMAFFGQDRFELALSSGSPDDPDNAAVRAKERAAAAAVLDGALQKNHVVALVAPSSSPAFPRDIVHGEPNQNGTGRFAAYAGYPHLTVPMGQYKGLPAGLSFIGPRWSEATLLSLGYAYEQARGPLPPPRFLRSLEEEGDLAATLRPIRKMTP